MKNSFLKPTFFFDLQTGFIISLIALPLSIGIALASGAPASAGLLAAMIGGILGSFLGGSELTINGPAAGLIVVVLTSIETLGQGNSVQGFKYFLAAMVIVGLLQIFMGIFKLASIGLAVPSAVVHGMLSAIGAIIIAKQTPVLLGVKPEAKTVLGLYSEFFRDIKILNPGVSVIGLISLLIMFLAPLAPWKIIKKFPMPLLVVITGVLLGEYFDLSHEHIVQILYWKAAVNPNHLLASPNHIKDAIISPDFSNILNSESLLTILSVTLIATIESVISTYAVDKIDPQQRNSDLNRDLLSKGICNSILGFIGGIPIISEIVRSSANIDNGAKTRFSNFFHGIFILIFVSLFPNILHKIPLSCMSAILIYVGWKLAHPNHFRHAYQIGPDHLLSFVITFIMTLKTDLLIGVGFGLATEIIMALYHKVKFRYFFKINFSENEIEEKTVEISIESPVMFSNSIFLRKLILEHQKNKKNIILNFNKSHYIDHTVLDQISRTKLSMNHSNLNLEIKFHSAHQPFSSHPIATRKKV